MSLKPDSIAVHLKACGYRSDLLRNDFAFGENLRVPLVGFAQPLADSRSACVAVISPTIGSRTAVEACKPLGTPLVFACVEDSLQWWRQGSSSADHLESIPGSQIEQFFKKHQDEFSPSAVYRAKTWGRFQTAYQLSFVDLGLMPLVEEQVGQSLGGLIERTVADLKKFIGWDDVTNEQGNWLVQTIFWLVSGKILHDKQVEGFQNLDLKDVEEVFHRVGKHYGKSLQIGSKKKLDALRAAGHTISQFSSLVLTTTEALAYVYENTMISRETRSALGTHSTPAFLVDYIVGNLADWVKELPVNDRSVFEPACGHAAFLVSAMRLLTELLPEEKAAPSKRRLYLRSRLHGVDIDPFALELARLSLTLTDIPNPDGWDLQCQDMFLDGQLAARARKSTILLANPPFDNFTQQQQNSYKSHHARGPFFNKSAEMLWQTLPQLPVGGVFGVVLPQTFLHGNNSKEIRKFLASECELREVCLFPDKVFPFSDSESAVLIGRRREPNHQHVVRYRRVRERDFPSFRSGYRATVSRVVAQSRFSQAQSFSLRLPELEEVWTACADYPRFSDVATLGRGIEYYAHLSSGSTKASKVRGPGTHRGFAILDQRLQLHELPSSYWLNIDPTAIRRPGTGTKTGSAQVLLNAAPVSRGPWRLKALIDKHGHPVTGNFITVRPTDASYSLEVLWALLNSPVANAYAFCHLGKRHNIIRHMRRIPLPKHGSLEHTHKAAVAYLEAAATGSDPALLQKLLLRVDSEVLKLYSFPLQVEESLLALFTDWERVGVPFIQTKYLPRSLDGHIHFSDFLHYEDNWPAANRERGKLISKNIAGTLTAEEANRLQALQAYTDYHLEKVVPRPVSILDQLEERLFSDKNVKGTTF